MAANKRLWRDICMSQNVCSQNKHLLQVSDATDTYICRWLFVTVFLSGGWPNPLCCWSLCLESTTWSSSLSVNPSQKIIEYSLTWPSDPFRCDIIILLIIVLNSYSWMKALYVVILSFKGWFSWSICEFLRWLCCCCLFRVWWWPFCTVF